MTSGKKIIVALTCSVLLVSCSERSGHQEETHQDEAHDDHEGTGEISLSAEAYEAGEILTAPVGFQGHGQTIQVTGALSYDENRMAVATARIGGRITRVVADFGKSVQKGEILAWIDNPDLGAGQAEYLRAESMSRLRRAEYERAQLLVEGEAISQGELLRREAGWLGAEAELKTAEQKLHILGLSRAEIELLATDPASTGQEYPVRAAISGRVTERTAIQGRVVTADDELFTIARLDSLWLFLQVFEKDLHGVKEGAQVSLTCESHPDDHFSGNIDFIGQVLDSHSRTVQARAVIENEDGTLKPGMFVYASIDVEGDGGDGPARLVVPRAAVARVEGLDVVFVQTSPRTFEMRPVTPGASSRDRVEILSGLMEGEIIAVEGVFILKSEFLKGGLEGHDH